jgi:hypothetical protein
MATERVRSLNDAHSILRWSSEDFDQAQRERDEEIARQRADEHEAQRVVRVCPTRVPEPHDLGEFPMTCYSCHVFADS